jgi:hypothetical protein
VNASSGTSGSAQELGVEAMGPFTHYVVKAHGNSRDVIVYLDVLFRSQLASEKGSPERRCGHRSLRCHQHLSHALLCQTVSSKAVGELD